MAKSKRKPVETTTINNDKKKIERKKKRRRFRRWFSFTLILGALGYAFIVGWTQLKIEHDQIAVLSSKTSGFSDYLEPGKFNWNWELILPTNAELLIYDADTRNSRLSFEAELPSSDVYASSINENSSIFSYSLRIDISYKLDKEYIVQLAKVDRITPDEMTSWYVTKEEQIRQKMNNWLVDMDPQSLQESFDSDDLVEYLNSRFKEFEFISASIINMDQPDYELYNIAKQLYIENLNFNNEIKRRLAEENIVDSTQLESRVDAMTKYGEVLSEYPELLEFFAIDERALELLINDN